jgi:multiple sugar transport system permease protein
MSKKTINKMIFYLVLSLLVLILLSPFLWLIIQSFQTNIELTSVPPRIKPHQKDPFINYRVLLLHAKPDRSLEAFESATPPGAYFILKGILNSLIVALGTTVVVIVFSCVPAYTFARFKFRYRNPLLYAILLLNMFPMIIVIVPLFVMINKVGLMNNLIALIICYSGFLIPYAIWMLNIYFQTIPFEIEESAIIDGCSRLQVLTKIIIPLAKPGLAATAIFLILLSWNEFLLAAIFMNSKSSYTLPVIVSTFTSQIQMTPWDVMIASGVIGAIVPVILVLFFQRHIISGLTGGAFK